MSRSLSVVFVAFVSLFAVVAPGCGGLIHAALELHGPIEAAITYPTADPVLVRAGLFAADVVVEAGREVELNVEAKGRIGTRTAETFEKDIGIAPLRAAEIADGRVTFLLPELTESTSLIAAAWIDENDDGKLTLRADGTLEPAYSPAIESMSTTFYLSTYGYDVEPRGYLAIATAQNGDDLVVEDKHLDQFRLEL